MVKRLLARSVGRLYRLHGARIIYFHSIHPMHPLAHRPELFQSMIELIIQSGKEICTISELGRKLRNGNRIQNCLAITFDDGYADNADIALPILVERNVKATFFVAAGLVEDTVQTPTGQNHLYSSLPMMSKAQLRELNIAGMEIGSHTFSHRYMRHDTEDLVRRELQNSKACLEDIIGQPVVSFAYPNGEVPVRFDVRDMLRSEGYLQAVTTRWGCVTKNSDMYLLPRQISEPWENTDDFQRKLSGHYDYRRFRP